MMPSARRFPPPWIDEVDPAPLLPCTSRLRRGHAGKRQGADMHRLFMRDHAPLLSVSKELLTWAAVISLTLLASIAWADPQSEISVYRKSYGLSAVTEDAKLTELARQQANAM